MGGEIGVEILLLRNQEEQKASAKKIRAYYPDARVFYAPLFQIKLRSLPSDIGEKPLIISSKNALRALKKSNAKLKYPLFVLGASSCEKAKELGFKDIVYGGQNAHQLAETIKEYNQLYPSLNYIHGDIIRFDIKDYLKRFGEQHVQKIKAYELETIEAPFEALPSGFFENKLYVLFYSKRQVLQFAKHVQDFSQMKAICISPAVFESASEFPFARLGCAKNPTEIAMLEEIKNQ